MMKEKSTVQTNLFLEMSVIIYASRPKADGLNWWNSLVFICLCEKKRKKKERFCAHICFLFSVQLIAAVYPFMSNHRCMYPHIPMPGSSSEPVAVCFMTALSLCLSLPGIFSQFKLISRCALLYKKKTQKKKTHFLSFCHVLYLPVSDAFIPLSLTFYISLPQFLYYCLSLSHSPSDLPRSICSVWADVHFWLLARLSAVALSLTVLLFVWLPPLYSHRVRCSCIYCFGFKCLF